MLLLWMNTVAGEPDVSQMISMQGTSEIPSFFIDKYEYPNVEGVVPTSRLSLSEAQTLCAEQGKRLCTSAEWRHACFGSNEWRYAYGSEPVNGTCHQSPAQNTSHTSMMSSTQFVPAGSFPDCKTSEGVVDMIGNLEEWVLDDWKGLGGALEGGASYTHEVYADCTGRYSRMPDYRLSPEQKIVSAGARCCWSETPLSQELISLDRKNRLEQAQSVGSYNPDDEVQLPHGGWMDRYEYPNRKGEYPLTGVTWAEASQLCVQAGKRLCGVYEWEQACSADGHAFSMGSHYLKGGCALELREPVPSGTMATCTNTYGLHDMSGGVWEWTSSAFVAPLLSAGLPSEMTDLAEIRGGSWMVEPQKGVCRPADGYPVTSKNMGYEDVGFRCCRGEEWKPQGLAWGNTQVEGAQCPDGMIGIGLFCIDRYEYPNERGVLPKGTLSWKDAQLACQTQGKRLCTEAEWILACEGPEWKGYPYGAEYVSKQCASKDRALGAKLVHSGAHETCQTPDGVFDMTGNVWEWTQQDNGEGGVLRGGGSMLSAGLGRCRSRAFISDTPSTLVDVGTRCCLDVSTQP